MGSCTIGPDELLFRTVRGVRAVTDKGLQAPCVVFVLAGSGAGVPLGSVSGCCLGQCFAKPQAAGDCCSDQSNPSHRQSSLSISLSLCCCYLSNWPDSCPHVVAARLRMYGYLPCNPCPAPAIAFCKFFLPSASPIAPLAVALKPARALCRPSAWLQSSHLHFALCSSAAACQPA